ncbi:MAG: GNAT family N-acetyltransferase [Chloroflexi bacterium]|nr:GNAT family N-acetyltransferase [Chloroflexota bacterium]
MARRELGVVRLGREPAPMSADCDELIERAEASVLRPRGLEDVYGVLVLRVDKSALWIENVAVPPEFQHRGLGRRLLHFAQQQAREIGMLEVRLYQRTDDREPGALEVRGTRPASR